MKPSTKPIPGAEPRSLAAAIPPADRAQALDASVLYRLVLLLNLVARPFYARYGRQFDLSITEWRVMMILWAHPDISAGEMCQFSGLHKMNVSRAVRRLERMGRVACAPDPEDGRRKLLRLSPEGERVHAAVYPHLVESEARLTDALDDADLERFRRILGRLIDRAQVSAEAE